MLITNVDKRLSALVLIRDQRVVNGYQFERYLPVGSIRHTLEELDRWQVDDVLILDISPKRWSAGPDLDLLGYISQLEIATPLTYGGGISDIADAVNVVEAGVERVCLGHSAFATEHLVRDVGRELGEQAVVVALPFVYSDRSLRRYDPRSQHEQPFDQAARSIPSGWRGEILLQDVQSDGMMGDIRNFSLPCELLSGHRIILSGGFRDAALVRQALAFENVSAVAVGNAMHSKELLVPRLKDSLTDLTRPFQLNQGGS